MNLLGLLADVPPWRGDAVGLALGSGLPEGADAAGLRRECPLEDVHLWADGGGLWLATDGDAPVRLAAQSDGWDVGALNGTLASRVRDYRLWLHELHGVNRNGRVDLGELLGVAWRFVGLSFVLFDGSFDLLAYAGDDAARSSALAQTIESGYAMGVSAEHQREYRRLQAENPLGFATMFQEGERRTPVWARTVRLRSGRSCQLHVMGLAAERLGVRELVEDVVAELRIMLERLETGGEAPLRDDYVQALVTRRIGSGEARRRARFFGWAEEGGYQVLRVVSVADQVAPTRWRRWGDRLLELVPCAHSSVMDDGLTALMPLGSARDVGVLAGFFEMAGLVGGLSDMRLDLAEAPDAYEEACVAAGYGVRNGVCGMRVYDECKFDLLVDALEDAARGHNLVPGYLLAMRAYDGAHGSAYAETLAAYVACRGSKTAACARLAIHRSTLDYRLERMGELFGVDSEDEWVHWHVGLLELAGRRGGENKAAPFHARAPI